MTPALPQTHGHSSLTLRWERYGADLESGLRAAYGEAADEVIDRVRGIIERAVDQRSMDLQVLDERRLLQPDWLQDPKQIGYVCYTDRFAGTLAGIADHLDYLESLGVTYLHLMPLLKPRPGESDGGYAVMDYRTVRDDLGTMADLEDLTAKLRDRGISLVMDLVLNHVTLEHEWAAKARAGDAHYRDYFLHFPTRAEPDAYEQTLPEVFPDFAPGNFTWNEEMGEWVWTTFNSYQWDVNWANPDVFCEYLDIILFLANKGVEVVRLDAIAFIWKTLGTTCQNRPEVHQLTQSLRAAARIAAPALAFKAEAIVGPADLITYFGVRTHYGRVSDLAYHNSYMVELWSALAAKHADLVRVALGAFPAKPSTATWAAYARCHDDIGWAITDEDAARAGLSGFGHRSFLSDFYAGVYPDTWARGLVFQYNPATGDRRISGTQASLCGLEKALEEEDPAAVDAAIARIDLLHAAILGFSGVPLLYMGDEIALTNDYSFEDDPDHADDNRWVHRPVMDWDAVDALAPGSPGLRVRDHLRHLIGVREQTPHLHASLESQFPAVPDRRLMVLRREHPLGVMLQVYNVSDETVTVPMWMLRNDLGDRARELISGYDWDLTSAEVSFPPYAVRWYVSAD